MLTAKAGEKVVINLENPDGMQHNLLIIKIGSLQKVGAAADAMLSNPKAAEMQYVPKMPEVLHNTKLVNPGETVQLWNLPFPAYRVTIHSCVLFLVTGAA